MLDNCFIRIWNVDNFSSSVRILSSFVILCVTLWYSISRDIHHGRYSNRNKNDWPKSRYFLDVDALDDEIHFAAATRVYKDPRDIRGRPVSLVTSGAIWNVNMQNMYQAAPNTIKFKMIPSSATINIHLGALFTRSWHFSTFAHLSTITLRTGMKMANFFRSQWKDYLICIPWIYNDSNLRETWDKIIKNGNGTTLA